MAESKGKKWIVVYDRTFATFDTEDEALSYCSKEVVAIHRPDRVYVARVVYEFCLQYSNQSLLPTIG